MTTMRDIGGEVPTEVEIIESRFYHEATALLATKEILQTCMDGQTRIAAMGERMLRLANINFLLDQYIDLR